MNRIRNIIIVSIMFVFGLFIFNSNIVKAETSYASYCKKEIQGTEFRDCGNHIFTYMEDDLHSSVIYAVDDDYSILYAGEKDGKEIFYARGFRLYNRSYDDRSSKNNNLWIQITSHGHMEFDGSFKDTIIDDSHQAMLSKWFNRYDTYVIRQFAHNGELYRTIVIYNVTDSVLEVEKARINSTILETSGVSKTPIPESNFFATIKSDYGIKDAHITLNEVEVEVTKSRKGVAVNNSVLVKNVKRAEVNEIKVTVTDYFGYEVSQSYKVLILDDNASITYSTITSITESTSRRVVINAQAGYGKELDTDYCWYYWSTSADDDLDYDSFISNYLKSEYKGTYTSDKGVILRNTDGTYYLYALAKDSDSYKVIRTEGFVLTNNTFKVNYTTSDAILVVSLLICCVVPISIYLYVRKRDY